MSAQLPGRVLELHGTEALVAFLDRIEWCDAQAHTALSVGEYVRVDAAVILEIISEEAAQTFFATARQRSDVRPVPEATHPTALAISAA